jgi:hypothetical protein
LIAPGLKIGLGSFRQEAPPCIFKIGSGTLPLVRGIAVVFRSVSILIGLTALAAIIAFTFRWEVSGSGDGAVYRLNRWTGAITWCMPRTVPPANLDCEVK